MSGAFYAIFLILIFEILRNLSIINFFKTILRTKKKRYPAQNLISKNQISTGFSMKNNYIEVKNPNSERLSCDIETKPYTLPVNTKYCAQCVALLEKKKLQLFYVK